MHKRMQHLYCIPGALYCSKASPYNYLVLNSYITEREGAMRGDLRTRNAQKDVIELVKTVPPLLLSDMFSM